jgi:hypothetical protein
MNLSPISSRKAIRLSLHSLPFQRLIQIRHGARLHPIGRKESPTPHLNHWLAGWQQANNPH